MYMYWGDHAGRVYLKAKEVTSVEWKPFKRTQYLVLGLHSVLNTKLESSSYGGGGGGGGKGGSDIPLKAMFKFISTLIAFSKACFN